MGDEVQNVENNKNLKNTQIKPKIYNDSIKDLYERFSLKKEQIEKKMKFIVGNIIKIYDKLGEDKNKNDEKNTFISSIGQIARIAINYSNDLVQILLE